MGDLRIRTATPRDATIVARLLEDSYTHLWIGFHPPELLAEVLPIVIRPNPRLLESRTYFIAELEGEPAGCGGWSLEKPGTDAVEPGIGHLRHFAVQSTRTRRGAGRLVFDTCVASAKAERVHELEVYSSLSAESFYAAMGFERIGPIDVPMTGGLRLPSVHMRRAI